MDIDSEDDSGNYYSYANYVAPVFPLPLAGCIVLDNQSKTARQLHAHCNRHGIRLSIPEGVRGFVRVDIGTAMAAKIVE